MTLLPIAERELRVSARHRKTYRARIGVAVVAVLLGSGIMIIYDMFGPGVVGGLNFLSGLTSFCFIFCIAAGAQATFDCLSEEKRQGTLGLLFLTDLKGYDILLGKLAATSLCSFYAMLAAFPVMAILIPLGRVPGGDFLRTALALLNVFFFSHTVGLFISAVSRKRKHASVATFFMMLLFWAGLPLGAEALRQNQFSPSLYTPLEILSPAATCMWAANGTYGLSSNRYWLSLGATHLLAWTFLVASSLLLPYTWQDKAYGPAGMRWRERFRQWCYGSARIRAAYRERLVNKSPFFWLLGRDRLKPLWLWLFLGALAGAYLTIAILDDVAFDNIALNAAFAVIATLTIKFWFASDVSRAWVEERAQGTLELLFCTPLSAREIFRGHSFALGRQFGIAVLLLTAWQIAIFVRGLDQQEGESGRALWIAGCIGYTVTMYLDLWALFWLAIWSALTVKNLRAASSAPILRVVILPPLIWYSFMMAHILPGLIRSGTMVEPSPILYTSLWFALGVSVSLTFGLGARRKLLLHLRQTVVAVSGGQKARLFEWRLLRRFLRSFSKATVSQVAGQDGPTASVAGS